MTEVKDIANGRKEGESLEVWIERIKDTPLRYDDTGIDYDADDDEAEYICNMCGAVKSSDEYWPCQCCEVHLCLECHEYSHLSCPEHAIPLADPFWEQPSERWPYSSSRNPLYRDRAYLYVDRQVVDKVLDKWFDLVIRERVPYIKGFYNNDNPLLRDYNPLWNERARWLRDWTDEDTEESVFKAMLESYQFDEATINLAWEVLKPIDYVYPSTEFNLGEGKVLLWREAE